MEAASPLGISYRQTKRLMKSYRTAGAEGLVHGNAGRRSRRAKPEAIREKALELVREHYREHRATDGPTLPTEHLRGKHEDGYRPSTLRRWMLQAGLWSRERKSRKHRRQRPRKEHFGELLQMDGSFHHWLEKRAGRS